METPTTHYARAGEVHLAYQVVGEGPVDLVYVPPSLQQVEHLWAEPRVAAFFERLARFSRLILFDRRGTGLSDPIVAATTLEDQMEDLTAVLDAAGSREAALFAQAEGSTMAALYAATHPERTRALVLYAGMARMTSAPGYEWPGDAQAREERIAEVFARWGTGAQIDAVAPSAAGDVALRRWFGALERLSASPGALRPLLRMSGETDVRDVLPTIGVPTLLLHRREDRLIDVRHSRYLAQHIPGARYVELEGAASSSSATAGGRSSRWATASLPRSTVRHARSAARWRCATRCASWGSSCGPACTPASARRSATTSAGSPSTSAHASARWPSRARCSSPGPSRIWWWARGSTSPIAASTS